MQSDTNSELRVLQGEAAARARWGAIIPEDRPSWDWPSISVTILLQDTAIFDSATAALVNPI